MNKTLQALKSNIAKLKQADPKYTVFGSQNHNYLLNPAASEREVEAFESRFHITLPAGYRSFLLEIGNGGAGPFYGLEPLGNVLFADLDRRDDEDLIDPSTAFAFEEPWNLEFSGDVVPSEEYSQFEDEYFDNRWVSGLIRICNFGCGVSLNLVVNGTEYGNIWVDDRCNDGGIYPDPYFEQQNRTNFLNWYKLWLDKSIRECF